MEQANQNIPETPQKQPKLTEQQLAIHLLRENGMSMPQIERAMHYKSRSGYSVMSKVNKDDLTNPKMVKTAHKVVKSIMEGKVFGDITQVKDSTALKAAEMVYDRHQPKITKSENLNINAIIQTPLDVLGFTDEYGQPEPIDTTSQGVDVCDSDTPNVK